MCIYRRIAIIHLYVPFAKLEFTSVLRCDLLHYLLEAISSFESRELSLRGTEVVRVPMMSS